MGVVRSTRPAAAIRSAVPFQHQREVSMYEMGLGSAEAEKSPAEKSAYRRGLASLIFLVLGLALAIVHRTTGATVLLAATVVGVAGLFASIKAQRIHRKNPELWLKPMRRSSIVGTVGSSLTIVVVAVVSIMAWSDTNRRSHDTAVELEVKNCILALSAYRFDGQSPATEADLRAFATADLDRADARLAGRRSSGHSITFATGKTQDEGERMARSRAGSLHAIELVIQLPVTAPDGRKIGGWSAGAVRGSEGVYVTSLPFWGAS